jgi:hypothetical protein
MGAILGAVSTFARGYDVVADGISGPSFLAPFRVSADRDCLAMSYVVLRPDPDTTPARSRQVGDELKDVEPIAGLHGAFA